jgi:hypothetical protein
MKKKLQLQQPRGKMKKKKERSWTHPDRYRDWKPPLSAFYCAFARAGSQGLYIHSTYLHIIGSTHEAGGGRSTQRTYTPEYMNKVHKVTFFVQIHAGTDAFHF